MLDFSFVGRQQHLLRVLAAAISQLFLCQKYFTHVTFTITLITLPWAVLLFFALVVVVAVQSIELQMHQFIAPILG